MENSKKVIEIPTVLTSNTFFWGSGFSASQRRSNEQRLYKSVEGFLSDIGFETRMDGEWLLGQRLFGCVIINVVFAYSESCKNVYKTFHVFKNGKKSNIAIIKKITESVNNNQ